MDNQVSAEIEKFIVNRVQNVLSGREMPDLPVDLVATDNLGEVFEKLIILHIRTWFLEDMVGVAQTDEEVAALKRKIDTCFKNKRPQYIEAINKMVDHSIRTGVSLVEDSVKIYKGH